MDSHDNIDLDAVREKIIANACLCAECPNSKMSGGVVLYCTVEARKCPWIKSVVDDAYPILRLDMVLEKIRNGTQQADLNNLKGE